MTPHVLTACDIPHSPPSGGRFLSAEKAAAVRDRLNEVARRDPAAVLGVLDFWLNGTGPAKAEAADR